MKSATIQRQRSQARRSEKTRRQRKDYERRRNINRNVPSADFFEEKEIFRSKTEEYTVTKYGGPKTKPIQITKRRQVKRLDGTPELEFMGTKTIKIKRKMPLMNNGKSLHQPRKDIHNREIPMIAYPLKRNLRQKYQPSKK